MSVQPPSPKPPRKAARFDLVFLAAGLMVALLAPTCASQQFFAPITSNDEIHYRGSATGEYLASRIAAERGEYRQSIDFLQPVLASTPNDPFLLQQLFTLRVSAGEATDSRALAQRLLAADPNYYPAALLLAIADLKDGNPAAAYDRFQNLNRYRPGWIAGRIFSAWTAPAGQLGSSARDWLGKAGGRQFRLSGLFHDALIHDPDSPLRADMAYQRLANDTATPPPRVALAYGNFLERLGRKNEARQIYRKTLGKRDIDSEAAQTALALTYRPNANTPKPLVPGALAGIAEYLYETSVLLHAGGDPAQAVFNLRLALYASPQHDAVKTLLAAMLADRGAEEEAITLYRSVSETSLYYPASRFALAQLYQYIDQINKAQTVLENLAKAYPFLPLSFSTLGDLYRDQQNYPAAVEAYSNAIATSREYDWTLYYARGIAYERHGEWENAEQDFHEALALSNRHPAVLNYLAYSWLERGEYMGRALNMLKEAVKQSPHSGHIVDSLGWAYYRMGDYTQAVRYLERATELSPGEAVINDHLGDALWRSGQYIQARFQWQRVIELETSNGESAERIRHVKRKILFGLEAVEGITEPAPDLES